MGGGGGLLSPITNALFGSPPSAPAAPNYTAAAQATSAGNLDAARQATAANRVNQVTPYGNLDYGITGADPYGNPTWTATQTLSPDQQQLYNMDIATSKGLGNLQQQGLGYVQSMLANPFSTSGLPNIQSTAGQANMNPLTGQANLQTVGQGPQFNQMGNAAQLQTGLQDQGMAGWDKASNLMMQRLQPQMEIQQKNLDAQLANQGLAQGTEAYNRAKMSLGMQQNDLLNQSQLQAQGIGQNLFNQALQGGQFTNQALTQQNQNQLANVGFNNQLGQQGYQNQLAQQAANNPALQQMYSNQQSQQQANNAIGQQQYANQLSNAGLGNAAQQQGFNQLSYMRNEPLNTLNAVRSGSQVQGANFVNPTNQATTTGPDYLSAAQAQGQYNMAGYNAQQAAQASANQGLMGLGGTLGAASILAPAGTFSDIRTKENIEPIAIANNGLTIYKYEYKPEFKNHKFAGHGVHYGYMAQEVEQVFPYAVRTLDDGYKVVDYGLL